MDISFANFRKVLSTLLRNENLRDGLTDLLAGNELELSEVGFLDLLEEARVSALARRFGLHGASRSGDTHSVFMHGRLKRLLSPSFAVPEPVPAGAARFDSVFGYGNGWGDCWGF